MKQIRAWLQSLEQTDPVLAVIPGPFILIGWKLIIGQVFFWGTFSLQFVPWWVEAWRQVSLGYVPLWNSLNGMGAPLLANYQTAFFYPPNWILWPLAAGFGAPGIAWGFTFLTMLHMIFAGVGTVLLLRQLGLGRLAQAVGGVAFSLSGYLVGRIEFISMTYVIAWLPWIFMLVDRLEPTEEDQAGQRRLTFSLPLAFSVGLMLLAGHAQLSWYTLLISAAWVSVKASRGGWRAVWARLASLGLACLVGAMIACVQLLPTAEYLLQSQRSAAVGYADAVVYSFWPWRILTLVAPDLFGNPGRGDFWGYATYWEDAAYIGMLPLLLSISTLPLLIKKATYDTQELSKKLGIFLWAFIGLGFILALGQNGIVFPFLYRYIPTFSLFQAPARYMIWVEFALVILAAFGIENWRCPQKRGLYWLRLAIAGAFAVTLGAGLAWIGLGSVRATLIRSVALAGFWALGAGVLTLLLPYFEKRSWKPAWNGLVFCWVLFDILAAGWSLNPMIAADFYAGVNARSVELGQAINAERVYIPQEDLQALKFARFLRFTDFRPLEDWRNMREVMLPNLNLLERIGLANNFDPMVPSRYPGWLRAVEDSTTPIRNLWLRAASVSRVEVADPAQPAGVRFDPIQSQPRLTYYSCALGADGPEDVLARFQAAAPGKPLLVIEDMKMNENVCHEQIPTQVQILSETPGQVAFSINAPVDGYISAAITDYPGWQASVDGRPVPLLRANYLFMALRIQQGRHSVVLQYLPRSFFLGGLLSILTMIILAGLAVRRKVSWRAKPRGFKGDS